MTAPQRAPKAPVFFTVREVAAVFGAHPQTVRRWVRLGVIGGSKAGPRNHKLFFTWADIRAFIDTRPGVRRAYRALL